MSQHWIVSVQPQQTKDATLKSIKSAIDSTQNSLAEVTPFEVPDLKFGTLDNLIALSDEMVKHDSFVEGVVHKVARALFEVAPNDELKVTNRQGSSVPPESYLKAFEWDQSKFPSSKPLRELLELLLQYVGKFEEDVRQRSQAFADLKTQWQAMQRKGVGTFNQRDLAEVLTPDIVQPDDFVDTEHLVTVVVVVPRGMEKEWKNTYETIDNFVVPRSTKQWPGEDKEGNTLWRVVLFKKNLDSFKSSCRDRRLTAREFAYDPKAHEAQQQERTQLESEKVRQESLLVRACRTAYSEVFAAWAHLKAVRTFVESVLRYGVPPNFLAVTIQVSGRNEKKVRAALQRLFDSEGSSGKLGAGMDELDDSEFHPYVFLTMNTTKA